MSTSWASTVSISPATSAAVGQKVARCGGGYAVGCEVEGASPDDRREEDHALARNRSAIGYTFMMQAGI